MIICTFIVFALDNNIRNKNILDVAEVTRLQDISPSGTNKPEDACSNTSALINFNICSFIQVKDEERLQKISSSLINTKISSTVCGPTPVAI